MRRSRCRRVLLRTASPTAPREAWMEKSFGIFVAGISVSGRAFVVANVFDAV